MNTKICANLGCFIPAVKQIKLANGTIHNRCQSCYDKKVISMRRYLISRKSEIHQAQASRVKPAT